jgi:multiple sugar transport system permease protein
VSTGGAPNAWSRAFRGWPFAAGYLPILIAFGIAPTGYALNLAFTNPNGSFADLGQFADAWNDYRFLPAFAHILVYTTIWLTSLTVLVVGLALLLHGRAGRLSSVFRFMYYMPGALAGAASVLLWLFMLDPTVSPFRSFLHLIGFHYTAQVVAAPHLPWMYAIIAFWSGAGAWTVILYGALNTIPADLEDAARIDGAGPFRIALGLKLPLIRNWVAFMLILSFTTATQLFTEPQVVAQATGGLAPYTWSPNQVAYVLGFEYGNFNRAAAISVELLLVGLVAAGVIIARTGLFRAEQ